MKLLYYVLRNKIIKQRIHKWIYSIQFIIELQNSLFDAHGTSGLLYIYTFTAPKWQSLQWLYLI